MKNVSMRGSRAGPETTDTDSAVDTISAITLDLDDTLWPIAPVIDAAESRLYEWLSVNCPRVARAHSVDTMRELRALIVRDHGEIAHDLTEVRRRSLERLIVAEGAYPSHYVDRAMLEFLEHRNKVELFPDVIPFLDQVGSAFPLLSISNGNADLGRIGLNERFLGHISAREIGAAKPDARIFRAACECLKLPPEEILHIGDHPVQDILGAARIGMKTVWVNRTGAYWAEEFSADHEVASLEQIPALLPPGRMGDLQ